MADTPLAAFALVASSALILRPALGHGDNDRDAFAALRINGFAQIERVGIIRQQRDGRYRLALFVRNDGPMTTDGRDLLATEIKGRGTAHLSIEAAVIALAFADVADDERAYDRRASR